MSSRAALLPRLLVVLCLLAVAPLVAIERSGALPAPQMRELAPAAPFATAGIAADAAGDVFEAAPGSNAVYVLPAATGTLFGQQVVEGVTVRLEAATGLDAPSGIAVDAAGDLLVANAGFADSVTVVPVADGTVFGQTVVANRAATLAAAQGIITPMGLALDAAGDLFVVSNSLDTVAVIPATTTTLFGQSVTANTTSFLSAIASAGLNEPQGIALDAAGHLFVADAGEVAVLSAETTTIFGQTIVADQGTTLTATSGLRALYGDISDVAASPAGDLFVLQGNAQGMTVTAVPAAGTSTILGQSVSPGTPSTLEAASQASILAIGLTLTGAGDLVMGTTSFNETGLPSLATEVIPAKTGTFCGTLVVAGVLTAIPSGMALTVYAGVATHVVVDRHGDAFVASPVSGSVVVVPAVSGILFGQTVVRGVAAVLSAAEGVSAQAIAIDPAGDLVIGSATTGGFWALAPNRTELFGQEVPASTLTPLVALSRRAGPTGLAFDQAGDLLGVGSRGLWVLPTTGGSRWGHPVTTGVPTTLVATSTLTGGLGVDGQDHVFVVDGNAGPGYRSGVSVLSPRAETVLGHPVEAGLLSVLPGLLASDGSSVNDLAVTPAGDVVVAVGYFGNAGSDGSLIVDPAGDTTRFGQALSAETPAVLSASRDHATFVAVGVGPGGELVAQSPTGLWGLGGTPAFVSPDHARARIGRAASIDVATVGGLATPEITTTSPLPTGLALVDHGDGTATISGIPADGTPRSVVVGLSATDHASEPVASSLTIDVSAHDTLRPGRSFGVGNPLRSRNGWYSLTLSRSGNLVLRTDGGRRRWSSHTKGSGAVRLTYSKRGVVLLLDANGHRVFRAGTRQSDPKRLRLRNNGDLVATAGGVTTWHSDTAGTWSCSPLRPHHVC